MHNSVKFILFIYLVSLLGCDSLYRLLHKEGAEEKELVGEVVPFEKNPTIEEIQILLKIYGYDPGKIDGVLGRRTRNAIERFQTGQDLKMTRLMDQNTWAKLRVFKDLGFVEEGKVNIRMLQTLLENAGFSLNKIDGKLGPKTETAIKSFQEAHGLKIDGKVGYRTMSALVEYTSDN